MADAAGLHRELFDRIQRKDLASVRELLHADYRYSDSAGAEGGADVAIQVAETYTSAFPDLSFEVLHEFSTADRSCLEAVVRGTHQAELDGIPATGKRVEVRLCNVIEVRDGKIWREADYYDTMSMMQQLGVGPSGS